MGTGNILLPLGLGLHLAIVSTLLLTAFAKRNPVLQNALKIVFFTHQIINYQLSIELVVEQANARESHGNAIFVASHDDMIIAN
jgi:hypothetical protein